MVIIMTKHDSNIVADIHKELHSHLPSEPALRAKALESLLVEKGMLDSAAVDAWIEVYLHRSGTVVGRFQRSELMRRTAKIAAQRN